MINVIILEDEKQASDKLRSYLARFSSERGIVFNVTVYDNAVSMLEVYKADADIIFVDIQMPLMNGMDAAHLIRERDEKVILVFVTNLAQYAIKGYEVDACDFAVKPVTYADFYMKMHKAVKRVKTEDQDIITFKMTGSIVKISASTIYYVEVIKHDLIYHTVSGEIKSHGTMREVEEKLSPYSFYRIHHSYLVNLAHVLAVHGDTITVNGTEIKISRAKKADFMQRFAEFAQKR